MRIGELGVAQAIPSGVSESMGLVNLDKALTHLRFWKLMEMVLEFQDLGVNSLGTGELHGFRSGVRGLPAQGLGVNSG